MEGGAACSQPMAPSAAATCPDTRGALSPPGPGAFTAPPPHSHGHTLEAHPRGHYSQPNNHPP